jgi:hypothetical protein
MITIPLSFFALLDDFKEHKNIKEILLEKINATESEKIYQKDKYYGDSINRLDWSKNQNFDREWVKYLKPFLQKHFDDCAKKLNYQRALIHSIWFQQYNQNDYHGWHIHEHHYTGVYYLQFPENAPKTEVIDHENNKVKIDAKEGDIVIFPSIAIHRAPIVKNDLTKTIVSFNIEFFDIQTDYMKVIDNL